MNKLNLKDITLLGIDCLDVHRLIKAADVCNYYADFAETKILSSIEYNGKYTFEKIKSLHSLQEYSEFVFKELNNYFETPYIFIFQFDGFILNNT